jgi:hypothetical protein
MKTENPSVCVTVSCKVCRSAIALYYLQLYVKMINKLKIQCIPRQTVTLTRDDVLLNRKPDNV